MTTYYLEARDIAHVAHDALYRAWFRLGGSVAMVPFDGLSDGSRRDAIDAVSAIMRDEDSERIPTSIPQEMDAFWRDVVRSAVALDYTPGDA